MKKYGMGGAYKTREIDEKCTQHFNSETWTDKTSCKTKMQTWVYILSESKINIFYIYIFEEESSDNEHLGYIRGGQFIN
jgi:hypothetical protein